MAEERLRLKSPLIVQFEITPECNNNCGFCYNFWQYDEESALSRSSPADEGRIRRLMDTLLEAEVPAVCFTGGEPLLAGRLFFQLLDTANDNRLYTSINTNGRLISLDTAAKLRESGLNSALVSLHGDSQQVHEDAVGCPGAFSQTLSGIENLVRANVNTTVNFVSTSRNVERIIPTAELLRDLGVKSMTATPLLPFPGVKDHQEWAMKKEQFRQYFGALVSAKEEGLRLDSTLPVAPCILRDMFPEDYLDYLEVLSPRVCMAGVTFMVVSPEGFNRACIQAPQLEEYGGDIREGFREVWNKSAKWSELDLIPEECAKECYALASCGGGCRTSSLATNDSTRGKTMYMGEIIGREESRPFIDRMEVKVNEATAFRKREAVRFRKEEFGGVLVNPSRQSFVILEKDGVEAYHSLPEEFAVEGNKPGISVLYAAGMLEPSAKVELPRFEQDVPVVHASRIYPRLAGKLPSDGKVRMLRADTGERIYF